MANIAKMELASLLFQKECIRVEKSFFGLKTKVIYTPTNSPLVGKILEYDTVNGKKVLEYCNASPAQVENLLKNEGRPESCSNGNTRVFLCYSADRKFASVQIFQYSNFEYRAVSDVKFFEGVETEKIIKVLVQ